MGPNELPQRLESVRQCIPYILVTLGRRQTEQKKEVTQVHKLQQLIRSIVVVSVVILAAGCSSRSASESLAWETPVPAAHDMFEWNTGDPDRRPVLRRLEISQFDVKNGWHIAPAANYKLLAEVEGADEVYFQAFDPGETPDPDKDGYLHSREHSPVEHPEGDPNRWALNGISNGGQTAAFYAVAVNEHGRTVSPVLFVAWNTEGSGYEEGDAKHPY